MGGSMASTPQGNGSAIGSAMAQQPGNPLPIDPNDKGGFFRAPTPAPKPGMPPDNPYPVDPNDKGGFFRAPQGNPLANMFGQNTAIQPHPIAQIQAPGPAQFQPPAQTPILPTQQQIAAQTQARMLARTPPPMAAPVNAPKKPAQQFGRGGGGSSR